MPRVVKLGIKRPATRPLLPDPEPREVRFTLISVDDHLMEPPEAFEGRMPAPRTSRAPRVIEDPELGSIWDVEGLGYPSVELMAGAGRSIEKMELEARFEEHDRLMLRQGLSEIGAHNALPYEERKRRIESGEFSVLGLEFGSAFMVSPRYDRTLRRGR